MRFDRGPTSRSPRARKTQPYPPTRPLVSPFALPAAEPAALPPNAATSPSIAALASPSPPPPRPSARHSHYLFTSAALVRPILLRRRGRDESSSCSASRAFAAARRGRTPTAATTRRLRARTGPPAGRPQRRAPPLPGALSRRLRGGLLSRCRRGRQDSCVAAAPSGPLLHVSSGLASEHVF
jgi:hypothetical protein